VYRHKTPAGTTDYFVGELALLKDGTSVLPLKWYTEDSALPGVKYDMWFEGYLVAIERDNVTGQLGWVFQRDQIYRWPAAQLKLNTVEMGDVFANSNLMPHPAQVLGTISYST